MPFTYRLLLEQFDIRKLQEGLLTTKKKYEREKDYTLKSEYRQTIQVLTDELNDLKKLRAGMEQLEQDIITAQSSLRGTIILVSQRQAVDASRLNRQMAKLRREVEVAKKVNEELAGFRIGSQLYA